MNSFKYCFHKQKKHKHISQIVKNTCNEGGVKVIVSIKTENNKLGNIKSVNFINEATLVRFLLL